MQVKYSFRYLISARKGVKMNETKNIERLKEITSFGYSNYKKESDVVIRSLIQAAFEEVEKTNHGRMDKETTVYLFRLHRAGLYNYMEVPDEKYKEILLSSLDVIEQELKYGLKLSYTTEEVAYILNKLK